MMQKRRDVNSRAGRGGAVCYTKSMRKYLAELLGTFALTLTVGLSLAGKFPVPTPILAGLTLGLFVYTIGHLSGSHINPAVTIGAWSIKKITTKSALFYILFQFIGAALAFLLIQTMAQPAALVAGNNWGTFFAEALGTFFFAFGIAAVIYGKVFPAVNGIVIGGSLLLGISIASVLSNGVLNPAVAMGIGSFSLAYLFGPIVGSVLGMQAFNWLSK